MTLPATENNKITKLFFILSGVFLVNVIIADLTGGKIFSFSKLLGIDDMPAPLSNLEMSVGVLIWPLVFLLSDIINEYFGKEGVKKISFLAAIMVLYSSIIVLVSTKLPPALSWVQLNGKDGVGNVMDINYAYKSIFSSGISIIIGSITAFLISQMVDVYAFHWIRKITGHKLLWLRATGSTVISQLIDSYVILTVAFYMLGKWNFSQVIHIGTMQYLYKISLAIILTPLVYLFHYLIDRFLGEKKAVEVIERTNKHW
jgi:uncharacterized integral membrane protein (TIGR00697 family)